MRALTLWTLLAGLTGAGCTLIADIDRTQIEDGTEGPSGTDTEPTDTEPTDTEPVDGGTEPTDATELPLEAGPQRDAGPITDDDIRTDTDESTEDTDAPEAGTPEAGPPETDPPLDAGDGTDETGTDETSTEPSVEDAGPDASSN